jgi:DNA-binding NtrC family response regulator
MKADAAPARLLVVDDEPSVLLTYRMILTQQGYEVVTAASSEEAKRIITEQPFDLLLCDLSLDERHTGFEVIEFGRQHRPGMPAVLLTGYASTEVCEHAALNDVSVLFKPVDIKEFLGAIREQLEQGKKAG